MESVSKRFENIYSNGFRHRYSEIACMIGEITEDPSQDNHESLDGLGVNLQVLEEYIRTHIEYDDEVYRGVYKLRDHVNLEMQRMEKQNTLSRELVKAEEEIIRIKTETEAELKTMTEAVKKSRGDSTPDGGYTGNIRSNSHGFFGRHGHAQWIAFHCK